MEKTRILTVRKMAIVGNRMIEVEVGRRNGGDEGICEVIVSWFDCRAQKTPSRRDTSVDCIACLTDPVDSCLSPYVISSASRACRDLIGC